ncbi:cytochrome C biogenesis protein [Candidatus Kaiserbacteria bacterium]|nr:MAG: cytochrome C biogenesis protein [Candidatus Kaiserbacteria bacterium]PCI90373.1 MAG: cytochrome C biogenesis protein [Candidatus Kaiserbacteria bacterium]
MFGSEVTLIVAFIAGIVSFLSPCVLPIVPGFLAYLTGTSAQEKIKRSQVVLHSALFVLGFSFVFAMLGVLLNTVLESVAYDTQIWLSRIGGVIIIFFGLFLMRLIRIPYLERAHTVKVAGKLKSKHLTSVLFGAAFAAGWTPCVSAALGAILGIAASSPGIAFSLLMAYSFGLGVPFLVIGFFAADAGRLIQKFAKSLNYINLVFGALLVILGVLIFTQDLALIANFEILNKVLLQ